MDVCFFSQLPRGGTYAGNFLLAFDPVPKGTPLYSRGFIPTSPYEQHRKQDCLEQQSMQTRLGIRVSSASQENNKCQQSGFFLNFGNTTTDHEI